MDRNAVPRAAVSVRSGHALMRVPALLLAAICVSCPLCAAELAGSAANSKQEQEAWSQWRKKYHSFPEMSGGTRRIGEPLEPQTPYVTFNVTRMYAESELVLLCELENFKVARLGYDLVVQPKQIHRVYKGRLSVGEGKVHERNFSIMRDPVHTGEEGYCHLSCLEGTRYLLFLNQVDSEERKARGYDKLEGSLYKVNRVWQGAILVAGKSSVGGDANSFCGRDRQFRETGLVVAEALSAVELLASISDGDALMKASRIAGVNAEKHLADAITNAGEGPLTDTLGEEFAGLPDTARRTFVCFNLWSQVRAETVEAKKDALRKRLFFRRMMLRDVVQAVAKEADEDKERAKDQSSEVRR